MNKAHATTQKFSTGKPRRPVAHFASSGLKNHLKRRHDRHLTQELRLSVDQIPCQRANVFYPPASDINASRRRRLDAPKRYVQVYGMSWFVIDQYGEREISKSQLEAMRLKLEPWSQLSDDVEDELALVPFSQLAVKAPAADVLEALAHLAAEDGLSCVEGHHSAGPTILLAHLEGWTFVAEPYTDPELRFVCADTVDALFEVMGADGLFFGYEEVAGILHIARFDQGQMRSLWYDAFEPGPSFALSFDDHGRCTEEDARSYAVRELGLPQDCETLDRVAFLRYTLNQAQLPIFSPDLHGLPIQYQLALYPAHEAQHP